MNTKLTGRINPINLSFTIVGLFTNLFRGNLSGFNVKGKQIHSVAHRQNALHLNSMQKANGAVITDQNMVLSGYIDYQFPTKHDAISSILAVAMKTLWYS